MTILVNGRGGSNCDFIWLSLNADLKWLYACWFGQRDDELFSVIDCMRCHN